MSKKILWREESFIYKFIYLFMILLLLLLLLLLSNIIKQKPIIKHYILTPSSQVLLQSFAKTPFQGSIHKLE